MDFVAYHDRTSADHQAHFDDLYPKGWRMASLSVYGARRDERYAAVWVKRAGPDWSAVHGVDFAGYQAAFDNAVAVGFKPVLLAATGPANDPVFAGTFEERPGPVPLTRHGLVRGAETDPATIEYWIAQARANGWMPVSIAVYGGASDPRYAGIWVDNPQGICWTMDGRLDSAGEYQSRFDALVPASARPVHVAVSPDGRYASIFRDDRSGDFVARHELTSAGYQQEFDQVVPQGYWPVSVQAGGVGGAARFAVVFGKTDQPIALSWRPPTGPVANAAIDDVMRQAMELHRIRGAALALVRRGRLVYARGYTLAETGYPKTQPTTRFRQASVSKFVVALAIHRLIQDAAATRSGGKVIVSDLGEFKVRTSTPKRLGATKIDIAILSHPHSDHAKNLIELLLSYRWPIDTAVLSRSDYWRGTQTNRDVLDTLDRFGTDIEYTSAGDSFDWGGAYWEVLSPATGQYTSSSAPDACG